MRILVAEDETIIRLDLREMLERAGFQVCAEARDGLEEGESYADAAARELREETGLEAPLVELGRHFVYRLEEWEPRYRPDAGEIHVESFLAEAPADWEPSLDWEHDEYRWCPADEGAALLFWPEPRELLQELAAR